MPVDVRQIKDQVTTKTELVHRLTAELGKVIVGEINGGQKNAQFIDGMAVVCVPDPLTDRAWFVLQGPRHGEHRPDPVEKGDAAAKAGVMALTIAAWTRVAARIR